MNDGSMSTTRILDSTPNHPDHVHHTLPQVSIDGRLVATIGLAGWAGWRSVFFDDGSHRLMCLREIQATALVERMFSTCL